MSAMSSIEGKEPISTLRELYSGKLKISDSSPPSTGVSEDDPERLVELCDSEGRPAMRMPLGVYKEIMAAVANSKSV